MPVLQLVLTSLLAASTLQAAPEAPPAPETAAEFAGKAYWDALHRDLASSSSPRERALGARVTAILDPVGGGKALRAAAQAAPSDALVQMLWSTIGEHWSGCEAASPCPEQSLAWAKAEPGNGLAWTPAFEATGGSGDPASVDADIARMANASTYDDHFVDYFIAYRRAVAARPMSPIVVSAILEKGSRSFGAVADRENAISIMAMANAAALPLPMVSLTRACNRSRHPELPEARLENCARIGRGILQSQSSVMTKMIGSSLVRVSGQETDADRQARRAMDWRQQGAIGAFNADPGKEAQYFADLASTGSEERAQELLMARHGIPLEPPANWRRN